MTVRERRRRGHVCPSCPRTDGSHETTCVRLEPNVVIPPLRPHSRPEPVGQKRMEQLVAENAALKLAFTELRKYLLDYEPTLKNFWTASALARIGMALEITGERELTENEIMREALQTISIGIPAVLAFVEKDVKKASVFVATNALNRVSKR